MHDLREFSNQTLAARARKGEQLFAIMPAIRKTFNLMGDDTVEISTESDALKTKIISYDQQWFEESKAKLLKQIDDEKRANFIISKMEKQIEKH